MKNKYDFSGWATKYGVHCSDGKTIMPHAFDGLNKTRVPLMWMHQHGSVEECLGHADLTSTPEGVWADCSFNDTDKGKHAKLALKNGDLMSLSIYANKVKHTAGRVEHGDIKEVSLVLCGANPEALIDFTTVMHADGTLSIDDNEVEIWSDSLVIVHSDDEYQEQEPPKPAPQQRPQRIPNRMEAPTNNMNPETLKQVYATLNPQQQRVVEFLIAQATAQATSATPSVTVTHADGLRVAPNTVLAHADGDEDETVKDVLDTLTEKQMKVVAYIVSQAIKAAKGENNNDDVAHNDTEGDEMKYNAFEGPAVQDNDEILAQSAIQTIFDKNTLTTFGSLKDNVIAHADDFGIEGVDWLKPDPKELNTPPEFLQREMSWVSVVTGGVRRSAFSRIRTTFADITADAARAKGYVKGNLKKNQVIALLRRETTPQTIYKKQTMHKEDVDDITDFQVVGWIKKEMRMMLDEEIARAILISDGRDIGDEDKIKEDRIRPIATDADLFTIKKAVVRQPNEDFYKTFIKESIRARKDYKGSGNNVILFTTEEVLTELLLLEDAMGRPLYDTMDKLCTKLRVTKIVTVPVMENAKVGNIPLLGIYVDLHDYNVGADRGGSVDMFEDFDIDYNKMKYLIETRISGALVKPYSAIAIFSGSIPTSTDGGVTYAHVTTEPQDDEDDEGGDDTHD